MNLLKLSLASGLQSIPGLMQVSKKKTFTHVVYELPTFIRRDAIEKTPHSILLLTWFKAANQPGF